MPKSIRPGDVLADRYRLVDLLVESRNGRFWRAHDRVLERHVALHVLDADDDRAALLLEAARQSATVPDRRLLRVLDADQVDGFCYVVNEWGAGSSLDIMLATDGPLAPRRAAWLVSEVATSVAAGHDAGVAHGRLVPENVLIDRTGSIRVIGFSVDAALHGLAPGRVVDRRRRSRRAAVRRADRPLARGLDLRRTGGAAGARTGAAAAAGPRRHPAPARRALRPARQPVRRPTGPATPTT